MTDLGSSLVTALSDEEKNKNILGALLTPELFKKVYEHFNQKQIPREDIFKNTLKREFKVSTGDVNVCYNILMKNIDEYNISEEIKDKQFLKLGKTFR